MQLTDRAINLLRRNPIVQDVDPKDVTVVQMPLYDPHIDGLPEEGGKIGMIALKTWEGKAVIITTRTDAVVKDLPSGTLTHPKR